MGKKKSKKFSSFSNHSANENDLSDFSSCQDISTSSSFTISDYFKVLLCESTENKDEYYKWTKNCYWKNIAFLQPSALSDGNSVIMIRGKSNCSIFLAKPLKSVKSGSVVLLNGMGFNKEEMVTLHPFERVQEAKEIYFTLASLLPLECLQDMLLTKLTNKFIWRGFQLQFVLFDIKSECLISRIQCSKSNSLADVPAEQISSVFSTLNLHDSLEEDAASVDCFITNASSTVVMSNAFPSQPELFPLFKHIGGRSQQIEVIKSFIDTFLEIKKDKVQGGAHILLLTGPMKSGKNMTISAISNEYGIPNRKINMPSLIIKTISASIEEIKLVVKNGPKSTPSLLMLNNLDLFCSLKTKDQIMNLFQHLKEICYNQVLIVASLSSEIAFYKQLLRSFSVQEVRFTLPTAFDREEVIQKIMVKQQQKMPTSQIKHCAELMDGLNTGDIFKILKYDAPILSLIRNKNTSSVDPKIPELSHHDILKACMKRKSCLQSSALKANKVKWSDIGGMEEIKKELKEELELLTLIPIEKRKKFNFSPSQGILLYGPPGCSKTMIAKALATECNWNFISKKASDIMNMYVGESEKAVANLFLEARVKAPSIIFLDEIDAIAPARNSSSAASGVQNRVVNCLLTEMAGIETLKDVLVIAATNRPDIIDDALLRRGRIGKLIYVPLPDCKTRKELFRLAMKKRRVSDDVDFDVLVEKTEGYTGAEIFQLCNEAAMQVLMEDPECQSPVFRIEHFHCALLAVPPLTRKDTIHFYEQFGLKNSKGPSL